jgi:hypothetical protein
MAYGGSYAVYGSFRCVSLVSGMSNVGKRESGLEGVDY